MLAKPTIQSQLCLLGLAFVFNVASAASAAGVVVGHGGHIRRATAQLGSADRSDSQLSRQAYDLVKRHALTKVRPDCLGFQVDRNNLPGKDSVDVREVHNARCGGDPDVEPRLFSIYFDRRSGAVSTDAYHPEDARIEPLR